MAYLKDKFKEVMNNFNVAKNETSGFIATLQHQKCAYGNAGLIRTQAESLKQLSAGIYTEEERFIYELLQNAVDAYIDTTNKKLDVRIEIKDDMLCFMHNGAPFTERDIEGLCDVGKSNKASDEKQSNKKKVGYKGIGFKSVFMQSVNYVCVKSGDYCFKFDKESCLEIMPKFPNEILTPDDIPWQIVPIACKCPEMFDVSGYNVATFIRNTSNNTLVDKIRSLLKTPQFLLFLNANNISISLINNGTNLISASRQSVDGEVMLLCNDVVTSKWLVHTTDPIPVNEDVREYLIKDFNTPQKLKEAKSFEISFAISINTEGEIEAINDSVVYTFLPTSYKNLGTPFLINANFITDAGRQQLHQHSEWNRLIFKSIPEYFFKWISTLSPRYKEYYKVLPTILPKSQDELTDIYSKSLKEAIAIVSFIPRINDNKVIKASEALIDRFSFRKAIGTHLLVEYINSKEKKNFNDDAFISDNAISLMKSYGVYIFDNANIIQFLSSEDSLTGIDINRDKELLSYLYDFCHTDKIDCSKIMQILPYAKIILDENEELKKAEDLFIPDLKELDDNNINLTFINSELYHSLSDEVKEWIGPNGLGIKEPNKSTFVKHILSHPETITSDNAINIGRFLYSVWKRENFLEDANISSKIKVLPFLTKNRVVVPISNLYMSSKFHPEDDLESVFDNIDYISTEYVENDDWEDWAFFLKKCGIRYKIGIESTIISTDKNEGEMYMRKYSFLSKAVDSFREKEHPRKNYYSNFMRREYINKIVNIDLVLYYFGYINPNEQNLDRYKLVFSKLLSQPYNVKNYQDRLTGIVNYWEDSYDDALLDHTSSDFSIKYRSFLEYVVLNEQRFPNVMGGLELARDTFLNTPTILKYGSQYLPIIDINSPIDDSWLRIIPFKKELQLEDYLSILSGISKSSSKPEKELISSIYQRLVELNYQSSPIVYEWGKSNKLLSASTDTFEPISQLSFITVEGFRNESQAYIGKIEKSLLEGVVKLLETLGVKVITKNKINPVFVNQEKSEELKKLLLNKLDAITLLKGSIKSKESFENEKSKIKDKISSCEFYYCQTIHLSYGNDNDMITKNTYAISNKFYYTGSLKPTRIGPLVAALSKHLELKNVCEEFLMVLITNNMEDLIDYLKDKGYHTEYISLISKKESPSLETCSMQNESFIEEPIESTGAFDETKSSAEIVGNNEKKLQEYTIQYKKYVKEYSEKIIEFMGGDFSMPTDKVISEHIITRYRVLMYIKDYQRDFIIKSDFNEKEYIRTNDYIPIPLEDGTQIHPQGAKFGIWHLSPNVWHDIIYIGDYACICTGNGKSDFKMIMSETDIKTIAESTQNVLMKMKETEEMNIMDTIKSILSPERLDFGNGMVPETMYSKRDVHLMLMVHKTQEPALNSIFDDVLKNEGTMDLD